MPTIDEHIAQSLREAQRSGELQSAPSWGKPLDLDDGYAQTPEELRMAFNLRTAVAATQLADSSALARVCCDVGHSPNG